MLSKEYFRTTKNCYSQQERLTYVQVKSDLLFLVNEKVGLCDFLAILWTLQLSFLIPNYLSLCDQLIPRSTYNR